MNDARAHRAAGPIRFGPGPGTEPPSLPVVVMQHVEEAVHLRHVRSMLVRSPQVRLWQLGRHDERLAAHLDGVAVAGEHGANLVDQALERAETGALFLASVRALEDRDVPRLHKLLAIAEAVPGCRSGLLSAFGWVAAAHLQGITKSLLESSSPGMRDVGLASCAMHGADPGPVLPHALSDPDLRLRVRGLRVAAQLGRHDLAVACLATLADDRRCAFEAARAALLLGDRVDAVDALEALAVEPSNEIEGQFPALSLVLKVVPAQRAQSMLASVAKDGSRIRQLVCGIAMTGDPRYAPWLIEHMSDPKLARLAGEAFSLITGLDLAHPGLELNPAPDVGDAPIDDPSDSRVAMDEDESLPWPDAGKIAGWWSEHRERYAVGGRYFMGGVLTPAKCLEVLRDGCQHQRSVAAEYQALSSPATPLFNTAAPAWRQRRILSG